MKSTANRIAHPMTRLVDKQYQRCVGGFLKLELHQFDQAGMHKISTK